MHTHSRVGTLVPGTRVPGCVAKCTRVLVPGYRIGTARKARPVLVVREILHVVWYLGTELEHSRMRVDEACYAYAHTAISARSTRGTIRFIPEQEWYTFIFLKLPSPGVPGYQKKRYRYPGMHSSKKFSMRISCRVPKLVILI